MNAHTLAAADPETLSFEATIRAVEESSVWLSKTYFYPESGGQPADEGTIDGVRVADVQRHDGEIEHVLAEPPSVDVGDRVTGSIDAAPRTYNRRAHTASHIVYGAGRRLFDATGYAGFDIGPERVRLDFETEAAVGDVDPLDIQRAANEVVWEDRSVEWDELDAAAARADTDIVFNLDVDSESDTVRIVEIDGWDVSACGGTHVRSTGEIGPIKLLSVSNPGANCLRVEYAVGPPAIERQLAETAAARRAADRLETAVESLGESVNRIAAERDALESTCSELRERLLHARLDALAEHPHEHGGHEWLVGTVSNVDANTVADVVRSVESGADACVLVGRDDATFVVVASTVEPAAGGPDAAAVVETITARFGGGGGGQHSLAQGGGLDVDPERVVAAIRDGEVDLSSNTELTRGK